MPPPISLLAATPASEQCSAGGQLPPYPMPPTPLPMQHEASTAEPRPCSVQDGRHVA